MNKESADVTAPQWKMQLSASELASNEKKRCNLANGIKSQVSSIWVVVLPSEGHAGENVSIRAMSHTTSFHFDLTPSKTRGGITSTRTFFQQNFYDAKENLSFWCCKLYIHMPCKFVSFIGGTCRIL